MHELTAALPGLSHGEGALWSRPGPDRLTLLASARTADALVIEASAAREAA